MGNSDIKCPAVGTRSRREGQSRQMHVGKSYQTKEQAAHRWFEQLWEFPAVKDIFGEVEHADEHNADQGGGQSEDEVEDYFQGAVQAIGRHLEGKFETDQIATDDRGSNGGNNNIAEGPHLQAAHQYLNGKGYTGNGGVECCGNSCCSAAGDEVADSLIREVQYLAHGRAEGSANLDDWTLPTGRSTRADAQ